MARALLEAGVRPDLVCGTSVGAINGAAIAADPTPEGVKRLVALWNTLGDDSVLDSSLIRRVAEVMRHRTSLHGNDTLRRLLRDRLPARRFEDLAVPFECVAASIERAREHWFSEGELIEPILASCALPGVFPPVRIGDEHFFDGGLVNSIPLERAVARGADTVWVLHVGRLEEELAAAAVFVAGRVRFLRDITSPPLPQRSGPSGHRRHRACASHRHAAPSCRHLVESALPRHRPHRPACRAGLRRDA